MAVAFAALALGGCAESPLVDGVDSVGNSSPGAYFIEPATQTLSIIQPQDNMVLNIGRAGATDAATYDITFSYPSDYAEAINAMFGTLPTSVSFGQGETETTITVPYNAENFPYDVEVPITVALGDKQSSAYGNGSITVTVFRTKYGDWEEIAEKGEAVYYLGAFDYASEPADEVGVKIRTSVLDPTDKEVAVINWFSIFTDPEECPADNALYFTYNTETNIAHLPYFKTRNVFGSSEQCYYGDMFSLYADYWGNPDRALANYPDGGSSYYNPKKGRFYFPAAFWYDAGEGKISWTGETSDWLQLPGYADYTTSVSYLGALFQESDGQEYAMYDAQFVGPDVAYALVGMVETTDAAEAVQTVINGTVETQKIEASGVDKILVEKSGDYTIAVVPYNSADEAQQDAASTVSFTYTVRADLGGDPNEGWTELGMCEYTDDYLPCIFNGLDPYTYEVPIQEKEDMPGYYRLVGPYQECNPVLEPGDYKAKPTYYLEIDATIPDEVFIPLQASGLTVTDGSIEFYSTAAFYLAGGYSADVVKANGFFGNWEDGVITFPVQGLLFMMDGDGPYYANSNGAFKVVLPEARTGAPLKSARRPGAFQARYNRCKFNCAPLSVGSHGRTALRANLKAVPLAR